MWAITAFRTHLFLDWHALIITVFITKISFTAFTVSGFLAQSSVTPYTFATTFHAPCLIRVVH